MSKEKKLTDEEIVKALEYCSNDSGRCTHRYDCVFAKCSNCTSELAKNALDLIYRLQDEKQKVVQDYYCEAQHCDVQKDIIEAQKAEIERLEKDVHDMSWIIKIHKYCVGADHCQNSSRKEFELQKQVEYLKQANDNALDIISQGEKQIL